MSYGQVDPALHCIPPWALFLTSLPVAQMVLLTPKYTNYFLKAKGT
jgi:hypothetical protein